MKDVSNKTLAILAVIAIAVGIIGILISGPKITGQAGTTQTGTTDLNITGVVSITLTTDTVDFGSGYVNESYSSCILRTSSSVGNDCVGFTAPGTGFILENDGNVNVSVTANSTTAASFIGGTSPEYEFSPGTYIAEPGGCNNYGLGGSFNASPQLVCSDLRFEDSADSMEITILVRIPDDANPGVKSTNVVFTATES